jgi:hypothetical protein
MSRNHPSDIEPTIRRKSKSGEALCDVVGVYPGSERLLADLESGVNPIEHFGVAGQRFAA